MFIIGGWLSNKKMYFSGQWRSTEENKYMQRPIEPAEEPVVGDRKESWSDFEGFHIFGGSVRDWEMHQYHVCQ